jgi:acyl-CoA thioesterase-1
MALNEREMAGTVTSTKGWLLVLLVLLLLVPNGACDRQQERQPRRASPPVARRYAGTIVAMGDSLTAGLGVPEDKTYPALLAQELAARGLDYRVINGGISGETSSGALERTDWVLSFKPDIVILETGANDGLRGIDPQLIERNLDRIVAAFQKHHVIVVLCGMEMVRNLGADYTSAFAALYPRIAERREVIFMPFFLAGVAGEPALNQPDSIHPTAAGYRLIVDNLLPHVLKAIELRREQGRP